MNISNRIVLASNNQGKLREFNQMLQQAGFEAVPQSQFTIGEIEETASSFVENAILKARYAASQTGLPALADDSGLEVEALYGSPGIYSARYSGNNSTDELNNLKLLQDLHDIPMRKRSARFRCCIVFMRHATDPSPIIADGYWYGRILEEASGTEGFGYDPLFYVPSHDCSAAELKPYIKNSISHRAQALKHLLKQFKEQGVQA